MENVWTLGALQAAVQLRWRTEKRAQRDSGDRKRAANAAASFRRRMPLLAAVLEKAVQQAGCTPCVGLRDVEERGLFSFLYEGISDPSTRDKFVRGGGFCPRHFRIALQQTTATGYVGPFQIADVCQMLLNSAAASLTQAREAQSRDKWPVFQRRRSEPMPAITGAECMFCADAREKEKDLVLALESLITDPAIADRVEANGLCQRHGRLAISAWNTVSGRDWVIQVLRRHLETLKHHTDEFLRKHDYRFREESPGPEADVVRRAVEFLLGPEATAEEKSRRGRK
jgi:hypothetical protein